MTIHVPIKMDEEHLKLLQKQKQEIIEGISKGTLSDDQHGVVHLIDHIQDTIIQSGTFPESKVFPK